MEDYAWFRTDTAGIRFSAINGRDRSRLFRMSAVLREEVDPERLQRAVNDVMPRFPAFRCRCRDGFFWGYLEGVGGIPQAAPEGPQIAVLRRLGGPDTPELEVLYYRRRISVEGSHVLGDGLSYLTFLRALLAEYLILGGADAAQFRAVLPAPETPDPETWEDAYARYGRGGDRRLPPKPEAYRLRPDILRGYLRHVSALIPADRLAEAGRARGLTVTEYLAAVMIRTVIAAAPAPITKKIIISVPVNLRSMFPSRTLRNFLYEASVVFSPEGRTEVSLEEICAAVRGQLREELTEKNVQAFIDHVHGLPGKLHLALFPFCIKKPVLHLMQRVVHRRKMTAVLSNLGRLELPGAMAEAVERIDVVGGNVSVYGISMFCSAVGFNGWINVSFSLCGHDAAFVRSFFRAVAGEGIPIRVESSDGNGMDPDVQGFPKRCPACRVELGEEYGICPLCGAAPVPAAPEILGFRTAPYPASAPAPAAPARPPGQYRRGFREAYFDLRRPEKP